jgi:hypothetical protein
MERAFLTAYYYNLALIAKYYALVVVYNDSVLKMSFYCTNKCILL